MTAGIELIIYDLTMPVQKSLALVSTNELADVFWYETNGCTLNDYFTLKGEKR